MGHVAGAHHVAGPEPYHLVRRRAAPGGAEFGRGIAAGVGGIRGGAGRRRRIRLDLDRGGVGRGADAIDSGVQGVEPLPGAPASGFDRSARGRLEWSVVQPRATSAAAAKAYKKLFI